MSDYVDEMVEAFVEALLWAGLDWESVGNGVTPTPLDENYDADDIHPDALSEIRHDCESFYEAHACILDWIGTRGIPGQPVWTYTATQCGDDFYLTREGHGTGFWDRGLGVLGEILTHDCKPYGAVEHYIHEGKICL